MAAGYATRLYPLTKEYPKPLLKVGRSAIIDYIVEKLDSLDDIDEIIVVTNSKFFAQFKKWRQAKRIIKPVRLVDDLTKSESDRRGAIADINFVINTKKIKDDLLVIGGDNLFDDDLKYFMSFVKANKNKALIGAYDIKDRRKAADYGVIKLDKKNKVVDFAEKPKNPKSSLIAMCLYYFPESKIKLVREYLQAKAAKSDATGLYIDWLRKKVAVYGYIFAGRWYDIGRYNSYQEAQEKFK